MDSTNILNLSLDEIIRLNTKKTNVQRRGQSVNQKGNLGGGKGGRGRGFSGPRGVRTGRITKMRKDRTGSAGGSASSFLSSRLGVKGMGRGSLGKFQSKGSGRVELSIKSRLGHAPQNRSQQRGRFQNTAFRQQLARRKLQQARFLLASSQQNQRAESRQKTLSERRGMKQTRGSLEPPLKVKMWNGAIVRGLRSDQLLLQRYRERQSSSQDIEWVESVSKKVSSRSSRRQRGDGLPRKKDSMVSLLSNRGLTVSITNKNALKMRSRSENKSKRARKSSSMMNSVRDSYEDLHSPPVSAYDERGYDDYDHSPGWSGTRRSSPSPSPPSPPPFQRQLSRDYSRRSMAAEKLRKKTIEKGPPAYTVPPERPLPKPHRQTLDPTVQKEIAMLQGKTEVALNSGPGPGIKGFRLVPNQTSRTLNERFTQERTVTT